MELGQLKQLGKSLQSGQNTNVITSIMDLLRGNTLEQATKKLNKVGITGELADNILDSAKNANVLSENLTKVGTSATGVSKVSSAISVLKTGFRGLYAAIGPVGIALIGLSVAIPVITKIADAVIVTSDEIIAAGEAAQEAIDGINEEYNTAADFNENDGDRLIELRAGVNIETNENISLTNDEYNEYLDLCNEIADIYPTLVTGYDSQGNAILNLATNAETATAQLEALLQQSKDIADYQTSEYINDAAAGYVASIQQKQSELDNLQLDIDSTSALMEAADNVNETTLGAIIKESLEGVGEGELFSIRLEGSQYQTADFQQGFIEALESSGYTSALAPITDSTGVTLRMFNTGTLEEYLQSANDEIDAVQSASEAYAQHVIELDELQGQQDTLNSEMAEMGNSLAATASQALQGNQTFKTFSEDIQDVMVDALNGIDWVEEATNNPKAVSNMEEYINSNFITPLITVAEDASATAAFGVLNALDKTTLSGDDYSQKVEAQLETLKKTFEDAHLEDYYEPFIESLGFGSYTDDGDFVSSVEEATDAIIERFTGGDVTAEDISETLSTLTVFQIETLYDSVDNASATWESSLASVVEAVEDTSTSVSDTFSSIFMDADGEETSFNESVDTFQSDISTLQDTLDSLKNSESINLTDLLQQFPELAGQTDDLATAIGNLEIDKLRTILSEADKAAANITDPEELEAYEQFIQGLISEVDFSDLNISLAEEMIKGLSSSTEASFSARMGQYITDSITEASAIMDTITDTFGSSDIVQSIVLQLTMDSESAYWTAEQWVEQVQAALDTRTESISFESLIGDSGALADDISSYTESMEALNTARETLAKNGGILDEAEIGELLSDVPDLKDHLDDLEGGIDSLSDAAKQDVLEAFAEQIDLLNAAGKEADASALEAYAASLIKSAEEIEDATAVIGSATIETPMYEQYVLGESETDAGDRYEALAEIFASAQEDYEAGLVGTTNFKNAAALLSPNAMEDASNWAENYAKVTRYFDTESSEGVQNFLTDLATKTNEAGEALASYNAQTGEWTYNITDMEAAADSMGISFEAFAAIMGRLEDYGFTNDFVSSVEEGEEHLRELYLELAESEVKLQQLKDAQGEADSGISDTTISSQEARVAQLRESIATTEQYIAQLSSKSAAEYDAEAQAAQTVVAQLISDLDNIAGESARKNAIEAIEAQAAEYNLTLTYDVDGETPVAVVEEYIDEAQSAADASPISLDVDPDFAARVESGVQEAGGALDDAFETLSKYSFDDLSQIIFGDGALTEGFNEAGYAIADAEKALDAIASQLGLTQEEASGLITVLASLGLIDIGVEVDTSETTESAQEAVNEAQATVENSPIEVSVKANLESEMAPLSTTLGLGGSSEEADATITVDADTSAASTAADETVTYVEGLQPILTIDGDTSQAESKVAATRMSIENTVSEMPIAANLSLFKLEIESYLAQTHTMNVVANVTTNGNGGTGSSAYGTTSFAHGTTIGLEAWNVYRASTGAYAYGNDWSLPTDEIALTNELGQESVVSFCHPVW